MARQGSGTRVTATATAVEPTPGPTEPQSAVAPSPSPRHDFLPGRGDLSGFPRGVWMTALRRALRQADYAVLDYSDPRGLPVLRRALAVYIGRARGLPVDPDRLVVGNGWVQGFSVLLEALRDAGARRVALEDPSMARNPTTVRRFGLDVAFVPVDGDGADPGRLPEKDPVSAVVLTPAHQYPTGATLSANGRPNGSAGPASTTASSSKTTTTENSVTTANRSAAGRPRPQPGRLRRHHVEDVGPGPAPRLLVLPRRWLAPVAELRPFVDRHTGALDQLALAEMINSGAFDRHVRHARTRYRRRRDLLLGLLADQVPALTAHGIAAGLHTVIDLPADGPSESEAVDHLARRGVAVHGLAAYGQGTATPTRAGLVVGSPPRPSTPSPSGRARSRRHWPS